MKPKNNNKKSLRIFGWASFLNDMGSDMIYPLWPIFVTSVLGAPMAALGFIDGLGEAIVSISQAVSGYLSDRFKKKKLFIWLGYLFGGLSRIGYAFSTTWQHIIPLRVLDRAGKIRGAPRDAMVADLSTQENRGKHFGFLRMMDNGGAVVGILVSILLLGTLGYKNLFLLAALPSLAAVFLVLFFIKDQPKTTTHVFKGLQFKDLSGPLKLFTLLSAIFTLGSFSYSFLLVFAEQAGFKVVFVPILYLIFTAVASLFSYPFGSLSDRIGRKKVLFLAFLFWGLVCANFIFLDTKFFLVIGFILFGLHKGALEAVQRAFVTELAPPEYRASILGGFQMVIGLSALPASFLAGLLWDQFGMAIPFYFGIAMTIVAMMMLGFVKDGTVNRST